ncbi:MAG: helix-turn-helix domain-containing protein [Acetivibrio ethanolgignens]
MLNENIKTSRKSKGLSQDELAIKLNVVRQTVSKWERGLSVPDSEMLVSLSEILETPVSTLLGKNIEESKQDDLKVISEKLEVINLQLAQKKDSSRKILHWLLILSCIGMVITFTVLLMINSSYLNWNYNDPELAIAGVLIHGFEWIFIRISPFALIALIVGIILTRKKSL